LADVFARLEHEKNARYDFTNCFTLPALFPVVFLFFRLYPFHRPAEDIPPLAEQRAFFCLASRPGPATPPFLLCAKFWRLAGTDPARSPKAFLTWVFPSTTPPFLGRVLVAPEGQRSPPSDFPLEGNLAFHPPDFQLHLSALPRSTPLPLCISGAKISLPPLFFSQPWAQGGLPLAYPSPWFFFFFPFPPPGHWFE